jgi:hypothetical protein
MAVLVGFWSISSKCNLVLWIGARYFCPNIAKSALSEQILVEVSNIVFYANPFSGSRFDMCGPEMGETGLTENRFIH